MTISSSLEAQSTVLGVKGGWINSGFLGEDADEQDKKSGINAGLFLSSTAENGIIGFQTELLFNQKGSSFQLGNFKEEYKLSYLEVPVLLKVSIPVGALKPNIFAGPYAAFKLSESYTYTDLLTGFDIESSDNTKTLDYGAVFGGGLDIDLNTTVITFDGRYNLGLRELENVEEPKDIKNGSFSFNVGIGFKL